MAVEQAIGCKHVRVAINGKKYRLVLSRTLYADKLKRTIALGVEADNTGLKYAHARQLELQLHIDSGSFDPTLEVYKSWNKSRPIADRSGLLNLGELWNSWCDYKQGIVAESTYLIKFRGTYQNALIRFGHTAPVNDRTAIALRNWLNDGLNIQDSISLLHELDNACNRFLSLGNSNLKVNPFYGMGKEFRAQKNKKVETRSADEILADDKLKDIISYTEKERDIILDYFKRKQPHYWMFVMFRFYTGCRIGESVELRWKDVTKDFSKISISRSWDIHSKKVKTTKTGKSRWFNCSDYLKTELMNYYLGLSEINKSSEFLLFTNTKGDRIQARNFLNIWNKAIEELVKERQLPKRLNPKNTRHSFVTIVRQAGYHRDAVARQTGHSASVEDRFYLDMSDKKDDVFEL